jgi:3-methyladenine DNA glycosylase/8-oxoguanine DNA glycosylase
VAVAAVLEQRVTGVQARGAWRGLLIEHGSPAPGPAPDGMRVSPAPSQVLQVPSWDWRRYGVDTQRLTTIREVAARAHVLARAEGLSAAEGRELLTAIPGVGPWTAAEISSRAFGDADAVSVGDYHLARNVTYALTGRTDGTDDDMVALLEVYAGHRFRVVRMVELARAAPARRGPRMRLPGPRGA